MIEVVVPPGSPRSVLQRVRQVIRAHPGEERVTVTVDGRKLVLGDRYRMRGDEVSLSRLHGVVHGDQ